MQTILPDQLDLVTPDTKYPQIGDRVQSSFIDAMFIITLIFTFSSILDRYENAPDWVRMTIFIGIFGLYEPVCVALGCTLGNYLKNIRVRQASDMSRRINIFQSLIRYVIKVLLGWLSFLTIQSSDRRRAIHDIVAGSVMIKI